MIRVQIHVDIRGRISLQQPKQTGPKTQNCQSPQDSEHDDFCCILLRRWRVISLCPRSHILLIRWQWRWLRSGRDHDPLRPIDRGSSGRVATPDDRLFARLVLDLIDRPARRGRKIRRAILDKRCAVACAKFYDIVVVTSVADRAVSHKFSVQRRHILA